MSYMHPNGGEAMVLRRAPTKEYKPRAAVKKTYRSQKLVKEQLLNYSNTGEDKQQNNRSSLSADSVTSTGEIISPNGIRLWGIW